MSVILPQVSLPPGVIVMWHGTIAAIPPGWALCNGANGTPDLRDLFVVGAKQDDGGVAKTNVTGSLTQTGGAATHQHSFSATSAAPSDTATADFGGSFEAATDAHTHLVSGTTGTASSLPPYFALAYIMKL